MSEELTPRQQILLWDLVSRGGSALQMELKPAVKPADREPLKRKRYISDTGRPKRLTLEEPGWNYLAVRVPTFSDSIGSKYDRRILQFVLERIQTYARHANVALAKLFTESHAAAQTIEEERATELRPDEKIEQEIRTAFFAIAGRPPRDKVRLSTLRARLPQIGRAKLDATLLAMRMAGTANLTNLDNPRDIESEKEAALQSGILTFHALWIDE